VFERFTDRARRVLVLAQEEARLGNQAHIGTEHLLLGLMGEHGGLAAKALESSGVSLASARQVVRDMVVVGKRPPKGSPVFTPGAKRVLERSLHEATQLGHHYVGTEHLLLALVNEAGDMTARTLDALGVDRTTVRQEITELMAGNVGDPPDTDSGSGVDVALAFEGGEERRLDARAWRALASAQEEARYLNHPFIGTECLLLGLLHDEEGAAAKVLASLGISLGTVRHEVQEVLGSGTAVPSGRSPLTPRAKKVMRVSAQEASQLGSRAIGTEHLLLGLAQEHEGLASQVLSRLAQTVQ
jgi:ATP-dependent Clp protease ATP-binding subunit ClpA